MGLRLASCGFRGPPEGGEPSEGSLVNRSFILLSNFWVIRCSRIFVAQSYFLSDSDFHARLTWESGRKISLSRLSATSFQNNQRLIIARSRLESVIKKTHKISERSTIFNLESSYFNAAVTTLNTIETKKNTTYLNFVCRVIEKTKLSGSLSKQARLER